jgi:hypothetical protein
LAHGRWRHQPGQSDACERTLQILARIRGIAVNPDVPLPVLRLL